MFYQKKKDDCGEAALKNLLELFYKSKKVYGLSFINSCKSFYEIKDSAKEYGLNLDGYKVNDEEFFKLKTPFIAAMKYNEKEHFVVVKRIKNNTITVIDSAKGIIKYKKIDFLNDFRGYILEANDFHKKKILRPHFLKFKETFNIAILTFVEFISAFITLCLLDQNEYLFSLIPFLLTLGISLIKKSYFSCILRKIDERLLLPFYFYTNDKEKFENLVQIKITKLKAINNFLLYFEAFALAVLSMVNKNIFYLISAFLDLGICLLIYGLFSPRIKLYLIKCIECDESIDENRLSIESYYDSYNKSQRVAKRFTFLNYFIKYLPYAFAFILTLIYASIVSEKAQGIIWFFIYNSFIITCIFSLYNAEREFDYFGSNLSELSPFKDGLNIDKKGLLYYTNNPTGG